MPRKDWNDNSVKISGWMWESEVFLKVCVGLMRDALRKEWLTNAPDGGQTPWPCQHLFEHNISCINAPEFTSSFSLYLLLWDQGLAFQIMHFWGPTHDWLYIFLSNEWIIWSGWWILKSPSLKPTLQDVWKKGLLTSAADCAVSHLYKAYLCITNRHGL